MNRFRSLWIAILLSWSLGPLLWQLYTSFSSDQALLEPLSSLDHRWTLTHYRSILNGEPPFWKYLVNSLIVSVFSTLLTLVLAFPAAYAITRLGKKIARTLSAGLVLAALFPFVLLFLALLEFARSFNLGNHLLALCLPYAALSQPLAILILAAAIRDLPTELEDAARLEGFSLWQRVRWILLPLLGPAITSTGILVFLFCWNEYPIALTWISDSELLTLPVAIARIAGSSVYSVPYGAYAAATVLAAIPLMILVIIFQKSIVSGLTSGAVKS
jgi:multiple sugar transport system permease protein